MAIEARRLFPPSEAAASPSVAQSTKTEEKPKPRSRVVSAQPLATAQEGQRHVSVPNSEDAHAVPHYSAGFPLPKPEKGMARIRAFGVSFFDGIGCFWLLMSVLQPQWVARWSYEIDPDALAVLFHRHPDVEDKGDIANFCKDAFASALELSRAQMVVVGAGSPCKQLSLAGAWWQGLSGPDSSLFWSFAEAWWQMVAVCQSLGVAIILIYENVLPADRENIDQITEALGVGNPVEINSAYTSWHRRVRLAWTNFEFAPVFQAWLQLNEEGRSALVVPPAHRLLPDLGKIVKGGFWPSLLEAAASREFPEGRFPVFTTRLRPGMEPHGRKSASAEAVQRCVDDGKIWPYYWYEDKFLLWREDEHRLLAAEEIESLMGMPRHYTSVPNPKKSKKSDKLDTNTRVSLLANSWDVGAFRFLALSIALLAGCPVEADALAATNTKAVSLTQPVTGPGDTPFQEMWGLSGSEFIDGYLSLQDKRVRDIALQFREHFDPPDHECNAFTGYRKQVGLPIEGLRLPDLRESSCRGAMVASAGEQAGWHNCANGWPRLVPEGLGEVGHFQEAHEVSSHPFSSAAALSHSSIFAVQHVCRLQEGIRDWRKKQIRHFKYKSKKLRPLTEQLLTLADEEAKHLYAQCHVGFVLYLCILLAHSDVTYATRCILGFDVVGEIESPPIFRTARPPAHPPSLEEFEAGNAAHLEDILKWVKSSPNPGENKALYDQTIKDVEKGFAKGPYSLEEIVERFGTRWRCFPRFAIHQAHNDKWRAIDDGKRSGHNDHTVAWVRVHTCELAFVAAVVRKFMPSLPELQACAARMGIELEFEGGTDDESSAYRWKVVRLGHRRYNVIAFWCKRANSVRFIVLLGSAFGAASAVINYNRGPEVTVTAARQLLAVSSSHFYDDLLTLGLSIEGGSGQTALSFIASEQGNVLDKDKHFSLSPDFIYVGCRVQAWGVFQGRKLLFEPKPGRAEKILHIIDEIEEKREFTAAAAASLLGKLGFLGGTLSGRVLRGCEYTIQQYKAGLRTSWSAELEFAFAFVRAAATRLPPRAVEINPTIARPPLLLWSDAEFSGSSQMGFGWVISAADWKVPLAGWGFVPAELAAQFEERKTQICMGEALAAISAPFTVPALFEGRDVLHFIDNQGALSCLINGVSRAPDVGAVACLYQLVMAKLECRSWAEYVESTANISDGPSRLGRKWAFTEECRLIGATLIEAKLPLLSNLRASSLETLLEAFPCARAEAG